MLNCTVTLDCVTKGPDVYTTLQRWCRFIYSAHLISLLVQFSAVLLPAQLSPSSTSELPKYRKSSISQSAPAVLAASLALPSELTAPTSSAVEPQTGSQLLFLQFNKVSVYCQSHRCCRSDMLLWAAGHHCNTYQLPPHAQQHTHSCEFFLFTVLVTLHTATLHILCPLEVPVCY